MRTERAFPSAVRLAAARGRRVAAHTAATLLRAYRRLNAVDFAQLHAKAAAGLWAVVLFSVTPEVLAVSLGSVLVWILAGLVFAGSIVSSVGLVIAARHAESDAMTLKVDLRRSLRGLLVEQLGLAGMLIGVSLYFMAQGVLSFGPNGDQRWALTCFAYFTGAMVVGRLAAVTHRRRKEARLAAAIGGTI